jgi:hypothetical protein
VDNKTLLMKDLTPCVVQVFELLALIGTAAHAGVQAEAVGVGAQARGDSPWILAFRQF